MSSPSKADLLSLGIEPIIGYERVQQLLPTKHTSNQLIYGARVIAGLLLISAESEYTHGTSTETYTDMTQTYTADRLKLGLRSGFGLGSLIRFSARGGVQASQTKTDQTVDGVTVTTKDTIRYNPYAGAGLRLRLTSKVTASAEVVAVFRNLTYLQDTEYQTTAGFAIRLP
jgi:hypothetical protein